MHEQPEGEHEEQEGMVGHPEGMHEEPEGMVK